MIKRIRKEEEGRVRKGEDKQHTCIQGDDVFRQVRSINKVVNSAQINSGTNSRDAIDLQGAGGVQ